MNPSPPADSFHFTLFTKSWTMPLAALGPFVRGLEVEGIELPVRPGFQVTPDAAAPGGAGDGRRLRQALRGAAGVLGQAGVSIRSVAGQPTPALIEACEDLRIPFIRILAPIPRHQRYWEAVEDMQRAWDRLVPLLDRHGVTLGVQNHCDRYLTHAMHLWHAIHRYDPKHVAAVWDPAHNALQGEDPELALDVLGAHLGMISMKNAVWRRKPAPPLGNGGWEACWTSTSEGLADWRRVARELRRRDWRGAICLHAEYTDEHRVNELIADDLAFARRVFAEEPAVVTG